MIRDPLAEGIHSFVVAQPKSLGEFCRLLFNETNRASFIHTDMRMRVQHGLARNDQSVMPLMLDHAAKLDVVEAISRGLSTRENTKPEDVEKLEREFQTDLVAFMRCLHSHGRIFQQFVLCTIQLTHNVEEWKKFNAFRQEDAKKPVDQRQLNEGIIENILNKTSERDTLAKTEFADFIREATLLGKPLPTPDALLLGLSRQQILLVDKAVQTALTVYRDMLAPTLPQRPGFDLAAANFDPAKPN